MNNMDQEAKAIYEEIRDRLCLLHYPPGEIISENALATEFGVSRAFMRHIMWQLENDGLINITKGSGAIVTTVDIKSLREVYVVRRKLIELIAELKPERFTQAHIAVIENVLEQTQHMYDNYDPVLLGKLYNEYHRELLNVIRNAFLKQITDQLYFQTARVWLQLLPELDWHDEVKIMCEEIQDVIEALKITDMVTVSQIRRDHMTRLLQRINHYLGSATD